LLMWDWFRRDFQKWQGEESSGLNIENTVNWNLNWERKKETVVPYYWRCNGSQTIEHCEKQMTCSNRDTKMTHPAKRIANRMILNPGFDARLVLQIEYCQYHGWLLNWSKLLSQGNNRVWSVPFGARLLTTSRIIMVLSNVVTVVRH
jgi:hypothetical protein